MRNIRASLFLVLALMVATILPAIAQTTTTTTTTTVKVTTAKLKDAQAPPVDKSVAVTQTSTSIGFLYLADGTGQSATALSVPLYTFPGTTSRLKVVAIGALALGTPQTQIYAGTGLQYQLYSNSSGWGLALIAGLKGFDIAQGFQAAQGAHQPVFGVSASIPIKGL